LRAFLYAAFALRATVDMQPPERHYQLHVVLAKAGTHAE
jgi:hypothetical protein